MIRGFSEFIIVCGLLIVVWVLIVSPALQRRAARKDLQKAGKIPWTVVRDKVGQATQVQVVKPGEDPYLIGSAIPITLPQWEYEEAMVERLIEAQQKADALNRRLPA